jgi:hypothetical protein
MWIHSWEDVHVEMRNGGVGRYFIRARDDTTISTLALSPILQVREDGDVERGDEDANARMRMRGEDGVVFMLQNHFDVLCIIRVPNKGLCHNSPQTILSSLSGTL